jgi:Spy/CpxP family protein refolding chaperone
LNEPAVWTKPRLAVVFDNGVNAMNIPSRTSRTPMRMLAAAVAALTLSLGAYAAGAAGPGPDAGPGAGMMAPWHHHGGMMQKQLADLHTRLKLNPQQEQLWQTAIDTMKRDHETARANRDKIHAQVKAMMQQPILDMNALHTAHMQEQQDNARLHEETATAWLAVYNALDDQQKTLVSDTFKQHFSKMESMRERMHDRWQKRHGAASEAAPAN